MSSIRLAVLHSRYALLKSCLLLYNGQSFSVGLVKPRGWYTIGCGINARTYPKYQNATRKNANISENKTPMLHDRASEILIGEHAEELPNRLR